MNRQIFLIVIILFFSSEISFGEIVFTTTLGDLGDITPAKARAIIENYMEYVSREIGEKVVFKLPEEGETTPSSYIKGKADIITTTVLGYAELVERGIPIVLIGKYVKEGKDYCQAGLYVHKDSKIKNIKDLKGKRIATETSLSTKNSVERLFLKTIFKKERIKEDITKYFGKEVIVKKVTSRAMALIFGEADAAIFDVVTIEQMAKLKKRYTEIHPIAVSEKFPWGALIATPKLGKEKIEKLKKILFSMHETARGRQFLFLLQFDKIIPAEHDDYNEIRKVWREFHD